MAAGDFQPNQANSTRVGMITQWHDDKGYGWAKCDQKLVFVHIKEFEHGQRRPKSGEDVRFMQGVDLKGRSCAKRVTFVKSGGRVGIAGWILLAILLVLPGLAVLFLPLPLLWEVPCITLVMSVITYRVYADDKKRASSGAWRVPESSLHLSELLGGWPGAFLAQRRLRHKCSKVSYQISCWIIVVIHQIVAADVILDQQLSRALIHFLLNL